MRKRWPYYLFLSLAIWLGAVGGRAPVRADGYIIMERTSSDIMADQQAVLIYKEGHEDLIISIGLDLRGQTPPQEMAWLIPTPSQPQVQLADGSIFDELNRIAAPEIIYRTERAGHPLWGVGAGAPPPEPPVTVLERKEIGIYDVAVLAGKEAQGVLAWLHREGFQVPDALQAPLDAYIAEGWTFVALRIAPEPNPQGILNAQPVWLSFNSERPLYPMRLTVANGRPLSLRLYILADHRYALEGFTTEFAGRAEVTVEDPALASVLDREFFLTKLFDETVTPAEMSRDFYPYRAASDEPYREQVVYTQVVSGGGSGLLVSLCPCGLCWLGLLGILVLLIVIIVFLKRREKTDTLPRT